MKTIKFWIPCLVGLILTPLFFYASTISGSGAASHAGGGFQVILFYPLPLITALFLGARINSHSIFGQIAFVIGIGLAVIQFPLFGFLYSYSKIKKGSIIFIFVKIFIGFHTIISILGLLLVLITIK